MNSSRLPSGSRKYTLVPRPPAPRRSIGPSSTSTPQRSRCAAASAIGPSQTKQRSLPPGRTGRRDVVAGVDSGPVDVQLRVAEPVRVAAGAGGDDLGADDVAVEAVRRLPVGDGDDAVVEADRGHGRGG
jgi:hypothetical protein